MAGQKGVRSSLLCGSVSLNALFVALFSHTLAVDEDICALAVCAQQYSILVYL
jgi:hypothetical protein